MTTKTRIPAKIYDGEWWIALRKAEHFCFGCGQQVQDYPAVARYRPEQDMDGGNYMPGWREHGWRVWWECPDCGHMQHRAVANTRQVAEWSGSGWRRLKL